MSKGQGAGFWLTLCTVYLVTSGVFSALAPIGSWQNSMLGFELWLDNDPGGCYLASAHELLSSLGDPLFPGHPGLTLQILLYATERAFFLMAAGRGEEVTSFVARNLHQFGFLARMLVTGLHLASFYLLFRFSRRLLPSVRAARLAVLGYATSLPVLYYLSRVSVEPLMVILFLATFLALWSYRDRLSRGARWPTMGFAALAAALAVSGMVTKLHLLALLPVLGLLSVILTVPGRSGTPVGPMWKVRSLAAATYVVASGASLACYSLLLDWKKFFELWGAYSSVSVRIGDVARRAVAGLARNLTADNLLPAATKNGIFLLSELLFLAVALVGIVVFFRRREADRRAALWPLAYSAYTLAVFVYRSTEYVRDPFHGFHYLLVLMAVLAVFFGVALDALGRTLPARAGLPAVAAAVLIVHAVPVVAVADSRIRDVRAYRPLRPFETALGMIRDGERVGVLHRRRSFDIADVHGLCGVYSEDRPSSVLADAFESLFVPLVVRETWPDPRPRLVHDAGVAAVVDLTERGAGAAVYSASAWAKARDTLRELLADPARRRDSELRRRVLDGILDGALRSRPLDDDRVRVAGVTERRWTVGDQPAAVAVQNPGERPLAIKLRIGTSPESAGTLVAVFVDDGQATAEHLFAGGSSRPVPIPPVPAGEARLFLVWSESPEMAAAHPDNLKIRLKGTRFRPRDLG